MELAVQKLMLNFISEARVHVISCERQCIKQILGWFLTYMYSKITNAVPSL